MPMTVERLLEKTAGPRFVAGVVHDLPERVQRLERVRTIGPTQASLLSQRFLESVARQRELATFVVDEAEDRLQLRSHRGSAAQLRKSAALRAGEELANSHPIAVWADGWIGGLEQVDENPHHLLRLVALEPGDAALLGKCSCLHCRDDAEGHNTRDEDGSGRDREAMPTHELARPVANGVGLGEHGPPCQESLDLLTQLTRRCVPALGFLAQRVEDDAIEVAANPPKQSAPVRDAPRRVCGR